jgi:hypothetical protein
MLTETCKLELRGEIWRGNLEPVINSLRLRSDRTEYQETCRFIIEELRKFNGVPHDKHVTFFVSYDGRFGQSIECGTWHDGGRDAIQFVGNAMLAPG